MTHNATPRIRPTPSGDASNKPAKPPSPPTYANASNVVATPSNGRPGVISQRNHSNEKTTIKPKKTGYAAVPNWRAAIGSNTAPVSASADAGRNPRACSPAVNSTVPRPTIAAASRTVQNVPCVKQISATTATTAAV